MLWILIRWTAKIPGGTVEQWLKPSLLQSSAWSIGTCKIHSQGRCCMTKTALFYSKPNITHPGQTQNQAAMEAFLLQLALTVTFKWPFRTVRTGPDCVQTWVLLVCVSPYIPVSPWFLEPPRPMVLFRPGCSVWFDINYCCSLIGICHTDESNFSWIVCND